MINRLMTIVVTSQTNIRLVSTPFHSAIFSLIVKLNVKTMINVLLTLIILLLVLEGEIAFFIVRNACFDLIIKLMETLDILPIIGKISS